MDSHWKKMDPDTDKSYFLKFTKYFLTKKTWWTIQKSGRFIISLFFNNLDLGFKSKFFIQFLIDIAPLGSGSVNSHIFADPDPGSQNLADPTDPDPKHWLVFVKIVCYPVFHKP